MLLGEVPTELEAASVECSFELPEGVTPDLLRSERSSTGFKGVCLFKVDPDSLSA